MALRHSALAGLGLGLVVGLAGAAWAGGADGQPGGAGVGAGAGDDPAMAELLPPDPSDPAYAEVLANNRKRFVAERELRKLRLSHFAKGLPPAKREAGLAIVRGYTDPATFPALLAAFVGMDAALRLAVLDHLAAQGTEAGDVHLAWAAIHDRDAAMRTAAEDRVVARAADLPSVPEGVQSVIAAGLKYESTAGEAAQLAYRLRLYEAIPTLIQLLQSGAGAGGGSGGGAGGGGGSGGGDREGPLGWIAIGRQVAFVSDLTPVVGANAVAYDPTVSVITEGSVLEVRDAYVTAYITVTYPWLVKLASAGWGGQSVEHLGRDARKWAFWYRDEFVPYRAGVGAGAAEPSEKAEGAQREP
jgi:hypothetical protein